jgi:phospholipid N-methyltransferase
MFNPTCTMNLRRRILGALTLVAAAAFGTAFAQTATEFKPEVGQAGKDVIWVPTPNELVDRMLKMAKVTPNDFVMDLGSGDGRTVIAAAKSFKARAMGVEYNPNMVALSNKNAEKEAVTDRVKFVNADLFETDLSQASVITMYLLPSINLRLRDKILALKPGTRVVSHAFDMGEWKADETGNVEGRNAYLWIVPAKAAGTWKIDAGNGGIDMVLAQTFQQLEGSVTTGGKASKIEKASLNGDQISFTANGRNFAGKIAGDKMDGTVGGAKFTATKIK